MLALFLGAAIMVAMYYRYRADNILRTSRSQQIQINAYRDANRDFMFCTTIKVFTDEDDDFNLREAEELCEMLNSK